MGSSKSRRSSFGESNATDVAGPERQIPDTALPWQHRPIGDERHQALLADPAPQPVLVLGGLEVAAKSAGVEPGSEKGCIDQRRNLFQQHGGRLAAQAASAFSRQPRHESHLDEIIGNHGRGPLQNLLPAAVHSDET